MQRLSSVIAQMSQQRVLRSPIAKAAKGRADGRPILDLIQSSRSSSRFVIRTVKTLHLQLRLLPSVGVNFRYVYGPEPGKSM